MTKAELVARMADEAKVSKTAADKALKALLGGIEDALKAGQKVTLTGFGTFSVVQRAAREGRNPQTGKKIRIKASKAPKFKAGKNLKDAVK